MNEDVSEAINLPLGSWVDSADGYVMLPGGSVIGKLSPHGLKMLKWHLYDLERLSSPDEKDRQGS